MCSGIGLAELYVLTGDFIAKILKGGSRWM